MCTNTHTLADGTEIACRRCDECLSTRKNTWVARCMAESAIAGETLAFTLTYAPLPTGQDPVGARVFRYKDVQDFKKRLRKRYFKEYGNTGDLRFVVCGERGSDYDRVHFHMIVFSQRPILPLGKMHDLAGKPLFERPPPKFRFHWDVWTDVDVGRGYIEVQEPGEAGIQYVLKYAFKDQFNVVKAKGTKRFPKAENHASGLFRGRNDPPIGDRYLQKKIAEWADIGAVPVTLNIKVPGYKGHWHPHGRQRDILIEALASINAEYHKAHGKDCPQWAALIASVSEQENQTDMEGLLYGQINPEPAEHALKAEREREDRSARERQFRRLAARRDAETVRTCGRIRPCEKCENNLDEGIRDALERAEEQAYQDWADIRTLPTGKRPTRERWQDWYTAQAICSQGCYYRDQPEYIAAFQRRRAIYDLGRAIEGSSNMQEKAR